MRPALAVLPLTLALAAALAPGLGAQERRALPDIGSSAGSVLSPAEQAIFDKLRWWRVETARAHNVPAYVVFQDATLRERLKQLRKDGAL